MPAFDVILRAAAAALWLSLAAGLAAGGWRARGVRWFVPLALGLAGFLAGNTAEAALQLHGPAGILAGVLSGSTAPFLWWFCLSVYDDGFCFGPLHAAVATIWWPVMLLDRGLPDARFAGQGLSWVLVVLGLAMCLDLVVRLLRDSGGDLVEGRRRGRRWVVAALLGVLLTDLLADIAMGLAWRPRGFTLAQNAALLVVAVMVARRVLQVDARALAYRGLETRRPGAAQHGRDDAGRAAPTADATPARVALRQRLERLMTVERIHRDPGLTIAGFAARMGAPEAEVRRLVNQDLGWRHFRTFLNHYRIEDAKLALADPAHAGNKILAIAFDAGFASLASFNRCFSQAEGMSPGEYRARASAGPPRE